MSAPIDSVAISIPPGIEQGDDTQRCKPCSCAAFWNVLKVIGVGTLACAGAVIASQATPLSGWSWAPVIIGAIAGGTANAVSSFAWTDRGLHAELADQKRKLAELTVKVNQLLIVEAKI